MADISIGSAVGSGFQLIARKPLTVMTWGLLRVLFTAGVFALFAPAVLGMFAELSHNAQANAGGQASQAAAARMMSHFLVIQGAGSLVQIVGLFVSTVTYCAVARAILHPERAALAYLRLGPPEFFLAVIAFAAGIVLAIGLFIAMIPFVIAIAILASQKLFVAMAVVIGLGALVLFAGLIYVLLRCVFVIPMMVDDGQFHLFDAWTLTKGRVGSLFLIGLSLVVILIGAEVVVGAFMVGLGMAAVGAAGGFQNVQGFLQLGPAVVIGRLAPWLIAYAVLGIPVIGCVTAICMAPWARAYRDVLPPAEPAAATPPPMTPPPVEPSPVVA